jgi:hypothetical protein
LTGNNHQKAKNLEWAEIKLIEYMIFQKERAEPLRNNEINGFRLNTIQRANIRFLPSSLALADLLYRIQTLDLLRIDLLTGIK